MLSKQVPFRLPLTKAKVAAATIRADTTTKVVSTNRVLISKVDLTSGVVTATITHRVVTTKVMDKVVMTNQDMISHMTPIMVDMVAVTGATMVLMGISNKQHQLQGGVVLVVVHLEVVGVAAGPHKLQLIERVH